MTSHTIQVSASSGTKFGNTPSKRSNSSTPQCRATLRLPKHSHRCLEAVMNLGIPSIRFTGPDSQHNEQLFPLTSTTNSKPALSRWEHPSSDRAGSENHWLSTIR